MFVPPMQWWHQHFNPGAEPARYLALKPWGFKFKVEDLRDTGEDVKKGGAQIEYEDQDSEIHKIFVRECETRGALPRMAMFGTDVARDGPDSLTADQHLANGIWDSRRDGNRPTAGPFLLRGAQEKVCPVTNRVASVSR
jgi:hypothetical protein